MFFKKQKPPANQDASPSKGEKIIIQRDGVFVREDERYDKGAELVVPAKIASSLIRAGLALRG